MEYKKEKYKGYNLYYFEEKFSEIGKKIVDKNYKEEKILKNTKRNFVEIISVNEEKFVLKENRNEHIIPQRKLMTFFKKGEALTTLINLNKLINNYNLKEFVKPFLVINKRKYGFITYSALIMENINGEEDRSYLDEIVKLMEKIHSFKIYHGDFNPGNFLLENGKIRIIDTQGKKMLFGNYRAHYDMLTMKMDSYKEMVYPYKKDLMYNLAFGIKKLKKLKFIEKIKFEKKKLREKGWKI